MLKPRVQIALFVMLIACGVVVFAYIAVQQDMRQSANDPQIQLSEDGASELGSGKAPSDIIGSSRVAAATSLAPFVTVYDAGRHVLASSGRVDGRVLSPPAGAFEYARFYHTDRFTWQPRAGLRFAAVLTWQGGKHAGYVLAARSLREVEDREGMLGIFAGLTIGAVVVVTALFTVLQR